MADYNGTLNKQVFYRDLDSFGVSIFMTYVPDSAAHYKSLGSMPIDLISHHWVDGYHLFYDMDSTLPFLDCNDYTINGRMHPLNTDPVWGYLPYFNEIIGASWVDGNSQSGEVRRAVRGTDSPGYLANRFKEGIFDVLNRNVGIRTVRFEADLKLWEHNVPDTTVVAIMVLTGDWRVTVPCDAAIYYRYRTERLDDTLL
ncbi:hypothetical protein C3F09_06480, partial [candidate division GN15 bacterium]